jgi:hypothetical protein
VVPARRRHARRRQEEIEDRFGLLVQGDDLAAKQPAEEPIGPRCLIHRRHVDQLVVHDDVHPIVARDRLEGEAERRDLRQHRVVGDDGRAGIAVVGKIGEQDGDRSARTKIEQPLLEPERVQEGAGGVRDEERFGGIEVDETDVRRLDRSQLRPRRRRRRQQSDGDGARENGRPDTHE